VLRLTGLLALLASGALVFWLARGLRLHVLAGTVTSVGQGALVIDPDPGTLERHVWGGLAIPSRLGARLSVSMKSDIVWLLVPSRPGIREGDPLRIEHREFVIPWTGWGVASTTYLWPGHGARASQAPVYAAFAGVCGSPLAAWSVAAVIATLASPRPKGIIERA
jgi:hypothetical protein